MLIGLDTLEGGSAMGLHDLDIEMSADEICDRGEAWRKAKTNVFGKLAAGTTVYIDIGSGDYVTGETWLAASDAFQRKFPGDTNFGYSFTVDRPTFVGGGIWLN